MAFDASTLEVGRLYTRPQLAELWGYEGFQALARGVFTPSGQDNIVLFVTRQKQDSLTQYDDFISGDRLHWEGEKGHGTDDRLAKSPTTGERVHLFFRDIHHTPFRYYGELQLLEFIQRTESPSKFVFQLLHDLSAEDDIKRFEADVEQLDITEREAVIQARRGQGRFRADLLDLWKGCAVTGLEPPDLLRASHIKPWRSSTNEERLNRFNGLLLLPQYDHLFDRGYISFDQKGRLAPSPAISTLPPDRLGIDPGARLRTLSSEHRPFLDYHREEVFMANTKDG